MKAKGKTASLDLYNNRHHIIHNINSQINDNASEETNNYNTSYTNSNSLKQLDSIGSSYLITCKNIKSNSILQKIKLENDKIRKKYFDFHSKDSKSNKNSFIDNCDMNYFKSSVDVNNKKNVLHPKKRKKILLKKNIDIPGTEKRKKNKNKKSKEQIKQYKKIIDFEKVSKIKEISHKQKDIIKNNNENNEQSNQFVNDSGDNNEEIYIYNGCNNFIIKEQNKQEAKIINIKPKNEISYEYIIDYDKNLSYFDKRQKRSGAKIYQKKITNNSLSLSKKVKKEENNYLKSKYGNYLKGFKIMKKEKLMLALNEKKEKYFKISNSSNNSPHNDNGIIRKNKIYKKPSQLSLNNKIFLYKSIKNLTENNNNYSSGNNSFYSYKNNNNNNNEKSDKKMKVKNVIYNKNANIKNDNIVTPNDFKEESDYNSYLNTNTFGSKNSLANTNNNNNNPSSFNTLEIGKNNNNNINHILFKEKIKPNLHESDNIKLDEGEEQEQNNNNIDNDNDFSLKLPKSEYNYFTKDKILIIKQDENVDENKVELKFINKNTKMKKIKIKKNSMLSNNYIPIKKNEENKNKINIPLISKEMIDKLNKKTENNIISTNIKNDGKKNGKESYSIDSKKNMNNNNNLCKIFKDNILRNKEEINNEKNKRYKIRSVVKVIKKSKTVNILNRNNITKEEENNIIQKIKSNKDNTKKEQEQKEEQDKIISILKEEIENYIIFCKNNNNNNNKDEQESKIEEKKNHKNYDWSIIEQLIIKIKVDLIDIINCFLLIFNEIIDDKNKLNICNEYIKLFIKFYKKDYLNENNIETIHIKILKILYQAESICTFNKYKYEILGNLFHIFLIEKMFNENDLNFFENEEEKLIIEIAKIVKFIIIYFSNNNDKKLVNEYYNKFKNTKIFNKNIIYFNYVTKYLNSLLNINQQEL